MLVGVVEVGDPTLAAKIVRSGAQMVADGALVAALADGRKIRRADAGESVQG